MEINFWDGFFRTIDCEFKDIKELPGASGIKHKILYLGIDHNKKRIVVAQEEQDARILAMVQADVQAKIKDYNILMIRPIPINLVNAFHHLSLIFGSYEVTQTQLETLSKKPHNELLLEQNKPQWEHFLDVLNPQIATIQKTKYNLVLIFQELIQQLSHIKLFAKSSETKEFSLNFEEILKYNPVVYDAALGICPIPLYNFSIEETDAFISKRDLEFNKDVLQRHSINQFFFPPIDSLALGLIETGNYKEKDLMNTIRQVPELGHPFGKNELVDFKNLNEIVDGLKEKGLVAEGEINLTITEPGKEQRLQVKFSPRESIFKRLSNIFEFKVEINLKDLFSK
ncbi:MAG: hypothetical protein V4642_06755 [Bacteroidota bacterium]